MRLKSIFYDWGEVNEALLRLLQAGSVVESWLAWLVSAVGSYWAAPLVLSAMAWRVSRARDARQAGSLRCLIRRFILAGMAASVLTWLLKGALNLPRPFSILGMAVSPIGDMPTTGSFPSGHSVYVAVLAATLWPLASARMRFGLMAFVIAVGWSRLALAMHFPADVVAGWLLGLGCAELSRRVICRRP